MKLFKKRLTLKKRVAALEQYLGIFPTLDYDGDVEYKRDADDKWNVISKIHQRIKDVEENKKDK